MRPVWLVVAAIELGILLAIPAPGNPDKPGKAGGIRTAAAQLRGSGPPIDFVQDYVGARDVARGREAYPVLTRAYASVGLEWPAPHRSTHPPTAFLLALPVAWLPWKTAAAVWTVLMLAALAAAYWALGAPPGPAVALAPLTLVWPPGGWSMGQLTPLWLLGLALAWRLRDRPAAAGAAVALASLTKLLPVLSLLPFLLLRRWSVLRGFAIVWGVALVVLLALDAGAIGRYLTIARSDSREQAARHENAALLWAAEHNYGAAGVAIGVALVVAVLVRALSRARQLGEIDRLSWDGVGWASVALLPIAWIYSLLPILPVLAFLPFTLAAFYQARRTANSACCRFLAVRICPKLEDTALVTCPPLNGAFRLSVPRTLNTCAISSSLVCPPTRIALAKRTSTLLYRSVSIWLAAMGARPCSPLYELTVPRFKSRLPWFRDVPGTYCRCPSALKIDEYALKGAEDRNVHTAPSVMSQGRIAVPLATRLCRRSVSDGPSSSDGLLWSVTWKNPPLFVARLPTSFALASEYEIRYV